MLALFIWCSQKIARLEKEQITTRRKLGEVEVRAAELSSELNLLHLAEERRVAKEKEPEILEFVLSESVSAEGAAGPLKGGRHTQTDMPFPEIKIEDRL
jgi:hypothetical protein